MSSREMISLLIDIVSKGGNLLLDVGPMHDGSLSHIQENRLNDLADWMDINSEGIELTITRIRLLGVFTYSFACSGSSSSVERILCQLVSSDPWKSSIFT